MTQPGNNSISNIADICVRRVHRNMIPMRVASAKMEQNLYMKKPFNSQGKVQCLYSMPLAKLCQDVPVFLLRPEMYTLKVNLAMIMSILNINQLEPDV